MRMAYVGFRPVSRQTLLKALHYFSHANNIERLAENNDLICDIGATINEMLTLIETEDPKHWQALIEAHT